MIEKLTEIPAPKVELPECDIKYVTLSAWKDSAGNKWWGTDSHKTLERAEREAEYCIPGTLRIFELPEIKEVVCH